MPSRPVLVRAFANANDLEVRSDQRTIIGLACPFDSPTEIHEHGESYTEEFRIGAFSRSISERGPDRIKALAQHDRRLLPVGRASELREARDGLHAELRISRTQLGDEILELVRDGALDGLSIGFEPIAADTRTRGHVVRTEVRLREISVVPFAAYDDARITGVRAQGTPVLDHARARTDALRAKYLENRA